MNFSQLTKQKTPLFAGFFAKVFLLKIHQTLIYKDLLRRTNQHSKLNTNNLRSCVDNHFLPFLRRKVGISQMESEDLFLLSAEVLADLFVSSLFFF